jgi:hypothetical protein
LFCWHPGEYWVGCYDELPPTPRPRGEVDAGIGSSENDGIQQKGHKQHPKKKARAQPFALARCRQKKKVGVEQEKVAQVILNSA